MRDREGGAESAGREDGRRGWAAGAAVELDVVGGVRRGGAGGERGAPGEAAGRAVDVGRELLGEIALFHGERGERERTLEPDAGAGGGGKEPARGEDGEDAARGLDDALEAIPGGGADAAQLALGTVPQVEGEEAEVGVAGEEVGGLKGLPGIAAAHPEKVPEEAGGLDTLRIEAVRGVDEREETMRPAGGVKEVQQEELAAAAGDAADDFTERAERQAAAKGRVDAGDAGGEDRGLDRRCGRTTARVELTPQSRKRIAPGVPVHHNAMNMRSVAVLPSLLPEKPGAGRAAAPPVAVESLS